MIYFENLLENEIDVESLEDFTRTICKEVVSEFDLFEGRDCEVSIYIVDDSKMQEINLKQRGIDKTTDVLSFPLNEMQNGKVVSGKPDINEDTDSIILGDIIISLPTCYRQADEYGHSFEREYAFLLSHGLLHLLGYDHLNEKDEAIMLEKQETVLARLGISRDM